MSGVIKKDDNGYPVAGGVSTADANVVLNAKINSSTGGLVVTDTSGGTVTSVSVTTANGVSGSVATATTTPAITLTLGAITPSTVNGNTITTGTGTLTLGSVTLNAGAGGTLTSSAFASAGQIPGTATNDSASAGNIGEYISSTIATANKIALTTATTANITNISLTAGDWDVTGQVDYVTGGATVIATMQQGASTTSATLGAQDTYSTVNLGATITSDPGNPTPITRFSLSATTTVYLVANSQFSVSTLSAYGTIRARRVR